MRILIAASLLFLSTPAEVPAGFQVIYTSNNLSGHKLSAECNPGGGSSCPCSEEDIRLSVYSTHGEVISNIHARNTYVNAIGYKQFSEIFPHGEALFLGTFKYRGKIRLPVLPRADPNQTENPQAVHFMVQFWNGRQGFEKISLEGAIYWNLNPWTSDYGGIKIYVKPLRLMDTGIILSPDTSWHTFELVVDLAAGHYVSITIDDETMDLEGHELARVAHPEWGEDLTINITTESLAAWPRETCSGIYTWTTQFKELEFSFDPSTVRPIPRQFRRGDVDQNGTMDLTDAVKILNYLFAGGVEPQCLDAADGDDSGELELTDPIRILNYLFLGTASVPEKPGPFQCGIDETLDPLDCEAYPGCDH